MTRFRFLDGWRRKSGSNCLKTEEEPHKLIVAFNLPTRHAQNFIYQKTNHPWQCKKNEAATRPSHTFNSGTALTFFM